eukprot:TRINITY_DN80236_c0_g1_i1.p1 TRINITY_DN80236_c0_g1~~TRINITY_DN80236_c0_g1_i1.p1  ORF type:complete len:384 (-),score=94.73 TRINITY_DN80236_c0_g1_i1:92-1150(-)
MDGFHSEEKTRLLFGKDYSASSSRMLSVASPASPSASMSFSGGIASRIGRNYHRVASKIKRTRSVSEVPQEEDPREVMHIGAYHTAGEYRMGPLLEFLRGKLLKVSVFDDVIHVIHPPSRGNSELSEMFFFDIGAVVIWGLGVDEEQTWIDLLRESDVEKDSYDSVSYEEYECRMGFDERTFIIGQTIVLGTQDRHIARAKLTMSYALGQSARLSQFEERTETLIDSLRPLTRQLASTGKISLSRPELKKRMGLLFEHKAAMNLTASASEKPDFLWDNTDCEPLYLQIAKHVELVPRHNHLNSKVALCGELYTVLNTELQVSHSTYLEWIVIILILLEIIFEVVGILYYGAP